MPAGDSEGRAGPAGPGVHLGLQFASASCSERVPGSERRWCLSLPDGPRGPGALHGHRRPVQEVLQGDLPGVWAFSWARKPVAVGTRFLTTQG